MGQHKYNPVAIAAKNGELSPKLKKQSKRSQEQELNKILVEAMMKRAPVTTGILVALGSIPRAMDCQHFRQIETEEGK